MQTIENHILVIICIFVFGIIGMGVFALSSDDTPKQKLKGAFLGFFVAVAFSYPTWVLVGQGQMWALMLITIVYTITGQFLPEFLQSIVPKITRKIVGIIYKQKTGEDLGDDR